MLDSLTLLLARFLLLANFKIFHLLGLSSLFETGRTERFTQKEAVYRSTLTERGEQEEVYRSTLTERGEQEEVYRSQQTERGEQEKVCRSQQTERGEQEKVCRSTLTEREQEEAYRSQETERGEQEEAYRSTLTERGEQEEAYRSQETERGEQEEAYRSTLTERGEQEEAYRSQETGSGEQEEAYRSTLTERGENLLVKCQGEEAEALKPSRHQLQPQSHLRRGDLLEVPRTLFTHFGIYLGEGRVAHLIPDILPVVGGDGRQVREPVTNARLLLGVLCRTASVRVDSTEDFAYGAPVLLNAMDRTLRRRPLANQEVAARAEKLIGSVPYSLMWNNCEHFVTYCRYSTAVSLQTDMFCEWLKSLIRDQRSVFLTAFLGVLSMACLGTSSFTALPALLIPFTLWMAG